MTTSALRRIADLWIGRKRADRAAVGVARQAVAHLSPVVLVTGASRGIGQALAQRFAAAGADVALVARHEAPLMAAAISLERRTGRRAVPIALDLAAPDAVAQIEARLAEERCYVDVLINNAACGLSGPFTSAGLADIERLIALNVASVASLTRHWLPQMLARRSGGVLNVASLGGVIPGPGQAAYYASKAFVLSLTEALGEEYAGQGVRICALAPGPADTEFHAQMGAQGAPYRVLLPALSSERVARAGHRGFVLGKRVIVPGLFNALSYGVLRALPHPVTVPFVSVLLAAGERNRKR